MWLTRPALCLFLLYLFACIFWQYTVWLSLLSLSQPSETVCYINTYTIDGDEYMHARTNASTQHQSNDQLEKERELETRAEWMALRERDGITHTHTALLSVCVPHFGTYASRSLVCMCLCRKQQNENSVVFSMFWDIVLCCVACRCIGDDHMIRLPVYAYSGRNVHGTCTADVTRCVCEHSVGCFLLLLLLLALPNGTNTKYIVAQNTAETYETRPILSFRCISWKLSVFSPFSVQIHHICCISFSPSLSRSACYTSVFCPFRRVSSWPSGYARVFVDSWLCVSVQLPFDALHFVLAHSLSLWLRLWHCSWMHLNVSVVTLVVRLNHTIYLLHIGQFRKWHPFLKRKFHSEIFLIDKIEIVFFFFRQNVASSS